MDQVDSEDNSLQFGGSPCFPLEKRGAWGVAVSEHCSNSRVAPVWFGLMAVGVEWFSRGSSELIGKGFMYFSTILVSVP